VNDRLPECNFLQIVKQHKHSLVQICNKKCENNINCKEGNLLCSHEPEGHHVDSLLKPNSKAAPQAKLATDCAKQISHHLLSNTDTEKKSKFQGEKA
jgi:hypothetical protein